jgi:hypothetical protein
MQDAAQLRAKDEEIVALKQVLRLLALLVQKKYKY